MTYFKSEQSKEANRQGALKSGQIQKERSDKLIEEYNKYPKQCPQCKKNLPYEKRMNKFCSQSCGATYNNSLRGTNRYCIHCGNKLRYEQAKYCSRTCQHNYQQDQRVLDGIAGHHAIRNYLIRHNGFKCQICQRTEWNNQPIPIVMDHIDGNPYNNSLDNLRLICPNCDAQTPTYKAKNMGNGRHKRRERYNEGKSY